MIEPEELRADNTAVLRGRRALHVAKIHRANAGDVLRVGVVNGRIGNATMRAVSEDEVVLEATLMEDPPSDSGIDAIIALPRPKVLKRVLAAAASCGVRKIVLTNARRVEAAYFDSPSLQPDAIREQLILGLEQGRDTVMPEVIVRDRFRPFIEDDLKSHWPDATRLLPDPNARQSIRALTLSGRAVVAIGPEGGWIPFESQFLIDHGFESISLGPRILRVETALAFVLGQWAVTK